MVGSPKQGRQDRPDFLLVTLVKMFVAGQVQTLLFEPLDGVETKIWRRRFLAACHYKQTAKKRYEMKSLGKQKTANNELVLWPSRV